MTVKKHIMEEIQFRGASLGYLILLLVLGLSFTNSSCDTPHITWSTESRSPDGKMIATANIVETSGIGTGDPGTRVGLNWTEGSQRPVVIFSFLNANPEDSPNTQVGLNWLTPTHLEITYTGPQTIDFQAITCHGIDISIRDISGKSVSSRGGKQEPTQVK